MRLSVLALQLLEENKIIELQSLPLNQLVREFDGSANSVCFRLDAPREAEASTFAGTAAPTPPVQPNPVALLIDPVVIASGYIFSRGFIQAYLTHENPVCPSSGVLLANKRVTPLPQVDLALQLLRFEMSQPYAFDYQVVSRFDAAVNGDPNALKVNVSANISVNRIQLKFSGENANYLHPLLESIFAGRNNCVTGVSYAALPWSIVWSGGNSSAEMMLRYASRELIDEQVAYIVGSIYQQINPLVFVADEPIDAISMDQLQDDEYPTIVAPQSIGLLTAVKIALRYLVDICEAREELAPDGMVFDDDIEIIPNFAKRRRMIGCFSFAGGGNQALPGVSSTNASSAASQTPSFS